MNEERPPVSFRAAKPVDKKTRHPFSGEPIGDSEPLVETDPHPTNPYALALADLKRRRDAINAAIAAIEGLL